MMALLTTSLLTSYGDYTYAPVSNEEVRSLLGRKDLVSFIRHPGLIRFLNEEYGIDLPVGNGLYTQRSGESALVFKLNNEHRINAELSAAEIKEIGHSFGLLTKI